MWEARFLFWEFLISFQSVVDLATTRLWGYHGLSFWGVRYIVFHAPKALSIVHQQSSKYKGSCLNLSACLAFRKDMLEKKAEETCAGYGQCTFKLVTFLAQLQASCYSTQVHYRRTISKVAELDYQH